MPETICRICSKKFYAKPSHLKRGWGMYCSRGCQHKSLLKGKLVKCAVCAKKIWRIPKDFKNSKSKKFFCGKHCQTIWRNQFFSGPKHPNWKNGENVQYRKILINNNVKRICNICGNKDKRVLVVHHLDKNHRNNDVKNLTWLCLNCHYLVHKHNENLK